VPTAVLEEPVVVSTEATAAAPTTQATPTSQAPQATPTTRVAITPPGGLPQLREEAVDLDTATGPDLDPDPDPDPGVPDVFQPHDSAPLTDTASQANPAEAAAVADTAAASTSTAVPAVADVPSAADVTPPTVVPDGHGDEPADTAALPDAALPDAAETDSVETGTDQDREQSSRYDYWDSEVDAQLAGQVYPVETDTEVDLPADQSLTSSGDGDANGSAHQPQTRELDDDAPPFATAPFATVPRLNRVRATPIPPADADDDEGS